MKNKNLCENCKDNERENFVVNSLKPDYIMGDLKENAVLSVEDIFEGNVDDLLELAVKMEEINRSCLLMYYLKSNYEDFSNFLENYQYS